MRQSASRQSTSRRYLVVVVAGILGCSPGDDSRIRRPGNPDVINVARNDPAMDTAIAHARASVGHLVTRIRDSGPVGALVKARFGTGDEVEHMWIDSLSLHGNYFTGRLANEPVSLGNLKIGDSVQVAVDEISDWMLLEDGVLIGGFTILELRRRMSETERAQFDRSLTFRVAADSAITTLPHTFR
jgi:uncharacterized protein YegJ (DUF2314 family)